MIYNTNMHLRRIQIPHHDTREDQEWCSECITWDLVLTRYPFALKGFCGLIFLYPVTPGAI